MTSSTLSRSLPSTNLVPPLICAFYNLITLIYNTGCYFSTLVSFSTTSSSLFGKHVLPQQKTTARKKNFCAGRLIFWDCWVYSLPNHGLPVRERQETLQRFCFCSIFYVVQCYQEEQFCNEHRKLKIQEMTLEDYYSIPQVLNVYRRSQIY